MNELIITAQQAAKEDAPKFAIWKRNHDDIKALLLKRQAELSPIGAFGDYLELITMPKSTAYSLISPKGVQKWTTPMLDKIKFLDNSLIENLKSRDLINPSFEETISFGLLFSSEDMTAEMDARLKLAKNRNEEIDIINEYLDALIALQNNQGRIVNRFFGKQSQLVKNNPKLAEYINTPDAYKDQWFNENFPINSKGFRV